MELVLETEVNIGWVALWVFMGCLGVFFFFNSTNLKCTHLARSSVIKGNLVTSLLV